MKIIKLRIEYKEDRDKLISVLANNGYKVWVEDGNDDNGKTVFLVIFELK